MLKRVSITGPESSGKSWLAKRLADYFDTVWVHEFALDYLDRNGAEYSIDDVEQIAKGQLELEEKLSHVATDLLFCDTDDLVTKIWSRVVFNKVPEWIDEQLRHHRYDLYLLCYPDLEWVDGPFRENPIDRVSLFRLYEEELKRLGVNYKVVTGSGEQRFKNAFSFVSEIYPAD